MDGIDGHPARVQVEIFGVPGYPNHTYYDDKEQSGQSLGLLFTQSVDFMRVLLDAYPTGPYKSNSCTTHGGK